MPSTPTVVYRDSGARYSVPGAFIDRRLVVEGPELAIRQAGREIARHRLVGPGEMSLLDEHCPDCRRPATLATQAASDFVTVVV